MPKAKKYTADELIKIILADGWREVQSSGGHRQYKHGLKIGRVTIPYHKGVMPLPTSKSILKQAGLKK
ncbi:MAG: type II toxin-antitoxin system HicA family toxin [Rickettsiales bacterium]|nr:type II toxin-antitoxin system HicA family toxin [Rickettsiales bacterium]